MRLPFSSEGSRLEEETVVLDQPDESRVLDVEIATPGTKDVVELELELVAPPNSSRSAASISVFSII